MLKLVGILCILTGCIGLGGNKVKEEKRRIRHLQEMIRIIKRIQNEISYGKHTLPEICLILSEHCYEPYRPYFRAIYEQTLQRDGAGLSRVWEQQTRLCLHNAPLQQEEKEILQGLLRSTGIQEENYQAESMGQSMDWLTRKCRQAEDAYENKSRMIFSLSVLAGVFLAILLV